MLLRRGATVERRWTQVDGVRLHSREAGVGAPVVLVHGLAVSSRYFVPAMRRLAEFHRAIAVDLPGFGRSEGDAVTPSVEQLSAWLARWLRVRGLTDAPLIGNSAGCQHIVDCAARFDDITGPLVLVGPTVDPRLRTPFRTLVRWVQTSLSQDLVQAPLMVVDVRDAGIRRIRRGFSALLEDPIESKLAGISQRVLVIRGQKDRLVQQRWVDEIATDLPDARVVVFNGARHLVHLTQPARFVREVRAFLGS